MFLNFKSLYEKGDMCFNLMNASELKCCSHNYSLHMREFQLKGVVMYLISDVCIVSSPKLEPCQVVQTTGDLSWMTKRNELNIDL